MGIFPQFMKTAFSELAKGRYNSFIRNLGKYLIAQLFGYKAWESSNEMRIGFQCEVFGEAVLSLSGLI